MDLIYQAAIGVLVGALFGVIGYLTKAPKGEAFSYRKLARTMFVYSTAGAVVAFAGDPLTQGNIEVATLATAVLGEVFDKLWSRATRNRASHTTGGAE